MVADMAGDGVKAFKEQWYDVLFLDVTLFFGKKNI
jgi:hypothetical protein